MLPHINPPPPLSYSNLLNLNHNLRSLVRISRVNLQYFDLPRATEYLLIGAIHTLPLGLCSFVYLYFLAASPDIYCYSFLLFLAILLFFIEIKFCHFPFVFFRNKIYLHCSHVWMCVFIELRFIDIVSMPG